MEQVVSDGLGIEVSDHPTYTVILNTPEARAKAAEAIRRAPDGYLVTFEYPAHSIPQRELMFALIDQLVAKRWTHDGYLMSKEDTKLYFLSGVRPGMRIVRNHDNSGYLNLDRSIKPLNKSEMQKMIDLIVAFADQRNWTLRRTVPGHDESEYAHYFQSATPTLVG